MEVPVSERLKSIREIIHDRNLDSFLVVNQESSDALNLYYLTGFRCSLGALIVTEKKETFLTDSRYIEAAREKLGDRFDIEEVGGENRIRDFGEKIHRMGLNKVGLDTEKISLRNYRILQEIAGNDIFKELKGTVTNLRSIKDKYEIELQRKAAKITDKALKETIESIKIGDTEKEVALKFEHILKNKGASDIAFEPTVASGNNSSRPHSEAGDKELREGELLLFDLGANIEGYCSDMTRTVCLGTPTSKQEKIYRTVLKAQTEALKNIEPGKKASEIDKIARSIIEEAGYGEYFRHSVGHGVGLEVHEKPSLSADSDSVLRPNMVVTVEPGIYLPGWGGVRIEDIVLVTDEGYDKLNSFPKEELKNIY